jgi:hypothetical protein
MDRDLDHQFPHPTICQPYYIMTDKKQQHSYYSLVGMVAEPFMQTDFCINNFDLHVHLNLSMVNLRFPLGYMLS